MAIAIWKKTRVLGVRVSPRELEDLQAALDRLRENGEERWTFSRMVREGVRMLAETAAVGHPPRGGAR